MHEDTDHADNRTGGTDRAGDRTEAIEAIEATDDCPGDTDPADHTAHADWDDDRWDAAADAELDALARSTEPGQAPPWEKPWSLPPRDREYDRRLAVLTADGAGEFLRACRASAGLSQRQLAEVSGVPQGSIARIEAGRAPRVSVATVARLAQECDILLVGTQGSHAPMLETDLAQRHRDHGGRLLPAHLFNTPWVPSALGDPRRLPRPLPVHTYRRDVRVRDVPDT